MKWLIISCLLLVFLVRIPSSFSQDIFIPDTKVKKFAQQADLIYYPLFLASFDWIKNNDTAILDIYYAPGFLRKAASGGSILPDSSMLKILPVFKQKNISDKAFPIKFPIDWSDTVNPDPSWRLWFQSLTWLNSYLQSTNPDSVNGAFCVINDWILSHLTYPATNERFAYDDHAVAERLVVLQRALVVMNQRGFSYQPFKSRLLLSVLNHIFFISSLEKYLCWHNHAIIFDEKLITALRGLPFFLKQDEFIRLAFHRVFEQYRFVFTSEGVHKEHSPCYHKDFSSTLTSLVQMAVQCNIPVPVSIKELHKKALEYTRYIELLGNSFPVGDCSWPMTQSERASPVGKFIDAPKSAFVSDTNNQLVSSSQKCKLFPLSGWMYVYDTIQKINIVAQSDFFSFSHYQQDETSFIIHVDSVELLIDPGLYSYAKSPVYSYYRSPRAHNVITVAQTRDSVNSSNTGLSGISRYSLGSDSTGNFTGGVEMTHAHYRYLGIETYRQFFFPVEHTMIIRDIIDSKEKHTFNQLFHLAPNATITKKQGKFLVQWPNHPYYLIIESNVKKHKIIQGSNKPLQGWYFPSFNKMAENPVLIFQGKGKKCDFVTRIFIGIPGFLPPDEAEIVEKYLLLQSCLDSVKRKTLVHQHVPARWKPNR